MSQVCFIVVFVFLRFVLCNSFLGDLFELHAYLRVPLILSCSALLNFD